MILTWFSWENVKQCSEKKHNSSTDIGLCFQKLASLEACVSDMVDCSISCSVCKWLTWGNPCYRHMLSNSRFQSLLLISTWKHSRPQVVDYSLYIRNTYGISMSALRVVPNVCQIETLVFPDSRGTPAAWLTCTSLTRCKHFIGKHICWMNVVGLFPIKAMYRMWF